MIVPIILMPCNITLHKEIFNIKGLHGKAEKNSDTIQEHAVKEIIIR